MKEFGRHTETPAIVGLSLAGLLAIGGCGGEAENNNTDEIQEGGIEREITYYDDGSRQIDYDHADFTTVFEFCDGQDLVEETQVESYGGASDIERSVDHAACDDGMLTPEDFPG